MKRIMSISLVFILLISISATAFATEKEDIFYYNVKNDSELQQKIVDSKSDAEELASYFLTQHLKYSSVDESKLVFHTDKAYALYEWNYTDIANFIKAKDKLAFLDNFGVYRVVYPASYNKKIIDGFHDVYCFDKETKIYDQATYALTINRYLLSDKQEAERILEKQGFGEYEVLRTIEIDYLWFIIAQKDNETVAIYVSPDNMIVSELFSSVLRDYKYPYNSLKTQKIYEIHKEKFERMLFTASDIEELAKTSKQTTEELSKLPPTDLVGTGGEKPNSSVTIVGGADASDVEIAAKVDKTEEISEPESSEAQITGELLAEDDDDTAKPFPWKYVGIGAGAVGFIGVLAVIIILALKKKKTA